MIKRYEYEKAKKEAAHLIRKAGLVVTDKELDQMDVADFGLSNLRNEGAQIVSLYDTEKISGRVIALFPFQAEPEHWHIAANGKEGKEETLRVITGKLYLVIEGSNTLSKVRVPAENEFYYTCKHEIEMRPGDVVTLQPGDKHWFAAGEEPCVFYSLSTVAQDAIDPFTNPHIVRKTVIAD